MLKTKPQVILALDVDSIPKAEYFVNKLYPKIKIFKVGTQLFTLAGPKIIRLIQEKGAEVFLDLKYFDIPNTIAKAVSQAVQLKVKMLTLHIGGGQEMLKAAVAAARAASRKFGIRRSLLIGVTILTSQKASPVKVLRLAKEGLACGLDGVVCSAREAAFLRKKINQRFVMVTPGIRPRNAAVDDQKRTATAKEAIEAGANFIVVGRPILKAKDPLKAVKEIE